MPLTYFKCVDTLLAYCNKSIPANQKNRPFGLCIKQMKRDLTPLTFQTSILCQRIGIAKDGFYSSMREGHKYNASDFEFLDEKFKSGEWSAESGEAFTCDADSDVNKDAPICIGMDYNANINWIVAYYIYCDYMLCLNII